ncbi:MAG: DUF7340 domain-containing protein [Mycobacterium sp.]
MTSSVFGPANARSAEPAHRSPCAHFAYHRGGFGEWVRARALRVSETGCKCLTCGAFWEPERFHWLARLLGCAALPGIS